MFLPAGTTSLTLRRVALPRARSSRIVAWSRAYHTLAVGAALLERWPDGRWRVGVSTDGRLVPCAAAPVGPAEVRPTRRALALFSPADVGRAPAAAAGSAVVHRPGLEFYGWSLLYQLPGTSGLALVDAHDEFADLPAFYESGAELVDRTEHLAARGVAVRPLALLAQPDDYAPRADGRPANRFVPRGDRGVGGRDH